MSRSFRTSDHPGGAGNGVPPGVRWARFRALAQFELRAQAREPLTTLYALVFLLLALGYASSDAVELVSNRGGVSRTSPWALQLAFGGLTAFGQVITTMVVTTAMLRDEALRVRGLVATTGVSPRTWLAARLTGAWGVMLAVYLAMPLGIVVGTALHTISAGPPVALWPVAQQAFRAFALITIPTTLVVTLVLASAAVRTQRVLGVLIAALGLVALWQLALALERMDGARAVGALLDPFANAPVLAATHGWSEAARSARGAGASGLLLANRALWMVIALALTGWLVTYGAPRLFAPAPPADALHRGGAGRRLLARLATAASAQASVRHFTRGWITLDGGWRIVAALAVLNAGVNAWATAHGQGTAAAVLEAVSTHARLFLILLATVYAGELVWRERDVGVAGVLDAVGVPRRVLFRGRVLGVVQAQLAVIGPLAALGGGLALSRDTSGATLVLALVWAVFVLWLPFVQLTVLSLAVHVVLNHKVAAHFTLITGWVLAVILDQQGVSAWWVRFAEPAPLLVHDTLPLTQHVQRGAYWSAVGAALLLVAYRRWPASACRSLTSRR